MEKLENGRTLLGRATDAALLPFQAATSKTAQKAYLGTVLFTLTSFTLLCLSTIAYTLFYYSYVPHVGIERVIHLQFGDGSPYGISTLSPPLTSSQPYDISLFLHLPRTPSNIAAGNFMLDITLLGPASFISSPLKPLPSSVVPAISTPVTGPPQGKDQELRQTQYDGSEFSLTILGHSRRPAILTYTSTIIDLANKFSGLPWYIMGWKKESEAIEVSMFEGVEFSRGSKNIPDRVKVVLEADQKMQVYEVELRIVARFGGLRYILYHHRILSFLLFTSTFFTISLASTFIAYLLLSTYLSSQPPLSPSSRSIIKKDPDADSTASNEGPPFNPLSTSDFSDTSRTFPTLGRTAPPLRYTSPSQTPTSIKAIKPEDEAQFFAQNASHIKSEHERDLEAEAKIAALIAEADDEDDDDDDDNFKGEEGDEGTASWRDSGIGTSLEEGGDRRSQVNRRRKALFGQGEK